MNDKQYFSDSNENAAFIRCADFLLEMIKKYGYEVKEVQSEEAS